MSRFKNLFSVFFCAIKERLLHNNNKKLLLWSKDLEIWMSSSNVTVYNSQSKWCSDWSSNKLYEVVNACLKAIILTIVQWIGFLPWHVWAPCTCTMDTIKLDVFIFVYTVQKTVHRHLNGYWHILLRHIHQIWL